MLKRIGNLTAALAAVALCGALATAHADDEEVRPAPRDENGRVLLAATPGEYGLWQGNFFGMGTLGSDAWPLESVPLQDWARELYVYRQTHELEPHARCKASGTARQWQTPYAVEILEVPELQRIYILDVGGPHTFRTIYLDGRQHPENPHRTGYGHSIGWWEDDTLVVESVGFNEDFWLDRRGIPHTDALRTVERFTRVDFNTIEYEITFHDPKAYTDSWTGSFPIRYEPGEELFEYICQEANYAADLMIGHYERVERSMPFVP